MKEEHIIMNGDDLKKYLKANLAKYIVSRAETKSKMEDPCDEEFTKQTLEKIDMDSFKVIRPESKEWLLERQGALFKLLSEEDVEAVTATPDEILGALLSVEDEATALIEKITGH